MKRVFLSLMLALMAFPAVAPSAAADPNDCQYERIYATGLLIHRFECNQGWTNPSVYLYDEAFLQPCYSVQNLFFVLEVRISTICVHETTGRIGIAAVGTIYVSN